MARTKVVPRRKNNDVDTVTGAPHTMGVARAGDSSSAAQKISEVSDGTTAPNLPAQITTEVMNSSSSSAVPVSIPSEIFGSILDELLDDKKFLLQCRLLSKNLRVVANSRAFRRLSVWCTGPAARKKGYFNVVQVPSLAVYVKEIIWKEETGAVDADAMQAFLSSIADIVKFPNVNILRFWFPTSWNEPFDNDSEMSPTRHLQTRIFNALAELYSSSNLGTRPQTSLQLLEIRGLITLPNESLRSDAFKALVQPIPYLVISVVTNDGEDFNHSDDDYSTFLQIDLTGLLNSARNLMSLTLESDIKTFYDWSKIETLPNLHHLELNNFVFGYLFSPEEFILRHKATIRYLDLVECWLDTEPHTQFGGPAKARVWKDVFETFERELNGLRDMVFKPLPGIEEDEDNIRDFHGYVWFDTEGGFKNSFGIEDSPCEGEGEEDKLAYGSLQKAIEKRKGKLVSV